MAFPIIARNDLGYVDRVLQATSPSAGVTTPKKLVQPCYGFRILTGANYIEHIDLHRGQDQTITESVGVDDERGIFDGMTMALPNGVAGFTFHWTTDVPTAATTEGIARAVVRFYTVPLLTVVDDSHGLAAKGSVRPLPSALHLDPTEGTVTVASGAAVIVADDPRTQYQQRKGSFATSRQHHTIGDDRERSYPWFPTTDIFLAGAIAHNGAANTDLDVYVYAYTYNGNGAPELIGYHYLPGSDNCVNLTAGALLGNPGGATEPRVMQLGVASIVAAGRSGPIPYPVNGALIYAVNQSLGSLNIRGSIWTYHP